MASPIHLMRDLSNINAGSESQKTSLSLMVLAFFCVDRTISCTTGASLRRTSNIPSPYQEIHNARYWRARLEMAKGQRAVSTAYQR